jgi:hypothetical protein
MLCSYPSSLKNDPPERAALHRVLISLKLEKEDVEMSSSSESASWLDRWWPLLIIIFGVIFVSVIVSFSPTT